MNQKGQVLMRIRTAAVAVLLATAISTAGCSPGKPATTSTAAPARTQTSAPDPEPTPSPTPTDPKQIDIDNAKAAYKNYRAAYDQVAQNYYHDWDAQLRPLTVPDYRADVLGYAKAAEAAGAYQVGSITVVSMAVTDYANSGGGHQRVTFDVCEDDTGRQEIMADGTDGLTPGTTGRFVATVTMAHAGDLWVVAKYQKDRGHPC